MKTNGWLVRRGAGLVAAAVVACAPVVVRGAETKPGAIPDFSSARVMWVLSGGPNYQPVPGDKGPAPIAGTDKYRPKIVDPVAVTDNPLLLPWAKKVMDDANRKVIGGEIGFNAPSRCFPGGVPGLLLFPGEPMEILQTPKEVLLLWKRDAQVRRIYLDVPHSKNPGYSWYGESVGHYENGDTLVVDTIGLQAKNSYLDWFRTPHTEKMHVVEHFKLSGDGKALDAVVKVEDPDTFNAPLYMSRSWRKVPNPLFEMVCAENNGDHFGKNLFPVPHADRADF
jgi:hypothetical protein